MPLALSQPSVLCPATAPYLWQIRLWLKTPRQVNFHQIWSTRNVLERKALTQTRPHTPSEGVKRRRSTWKQSSAVFKADPTSAFSSPLQRIESIPDAYAQSEARTSPMLIYDSAAKFLSRSNPKGFSNRRQDGQSTSILMSTGSLGRSRKLHKAHGPRQKSPPYFRGRLCGMASSQCGSDERAIYDISIQAWPRWHNDKMSFSLHSNTPPAKLHCS